MFFSRNCHAECGPEIRVHRTPRRSCCPRSPVKTVSPFSSRPKVSYDITSATWEEVSWYNYHGYYTGWLEIRTFGHSYSIFNILLGNTVDKYSLWNMYVLLSI